jgi:hypothetical protein
LSRQFLEDDIMRTAAAIVFGLVLAAAARGGEGIPSRQVLADMGLGGLKILSDDEAASVRGMGFVGIGGGADLFKDSLRNYEKQVKQFHKEVNKFQWAIEKHLQRWPGSVSPPTHHDMKPPKMPGGGKPW